MTGHPSRRPHTEIGTVSCDGHITLQRFAPVSPGYDIGPGCSNELSYGELERNICALAHRYGLWIQLLIPRMMWWRSHMVYTSASKQGNIWNINLLGLGWWVSHDCNRITWTDFLALDIRVGDGQGGLACCGSWGCRVGHDWATELNWTDELSMALASFNKHCDYQRLSEVTYSAKSSITLTIILASSQGAGDIMGSNSSWVNFLLGPPTLLYVSCKVEH